MSDEMNNSNAPSPADDAAPFEDPAEAEISADADLAEDGDEAADLAHEARALEGGFEEGAPALDEAAGSTQPASEEGSGSATSPATHAVLTAAPPSSRFRKGDWEQQFSAQALAVELHRVEEEVRQMVEERDPRRKRKFTGTRRWHELEEDLLSMRFTGRMDEDAIREALRLIARRHFLFRQLRFVAATRPTWNT